MMKSNNAPLSETVSNYASQCVKCALCLDHCPTYRLTQDENESPRGRIALFQAVAEEALPLTAKVKQHLDQCLGCRACEKVCPANVEYGALLATGRALVRQRAPALTKEPFSVRLLRWLAQHPRLHPSLHWLLWVSQKSGLRKIARALRLPTLLGVQRLETLLPPINRPQKVKSYYAPIGKAQGSVQLFTGCLHTWCEEQTLFATIFVLRQLGFQVSIPANQTCCGAMALHSGLLAQTQTLAQQNANAFAAPNIPIISLATGCQAVLQDYAKLFPSTTVFSSQIVDVMRFIQQCDWPASSSLAPIAGKVMLHTPCTQRNAVKNPPHVSSILEKIPQLLIEPFSSPYCCGSAGTYMLEHPEFSEPLLNKLLSELVDKKVDYLATSNIGCALYFKEALQKSQTPITVVHPIVLIANSLGFKDF